jgi:hypothetical protein
LPSAVEREEDSTELPDFRKERLADSGKPGIGLQHRVL